jgi:hypothetical protein
MFLGTLVGGNIGFQMEMILQKLIQNLRQYSHF